MADPQGFVDFVTNVFSNGQSEVYECSHDPSGQFVVSISYEVNKHGKLVTPRISRQIVDKFTGEEASIRYEAPGSDIYSPMPTIANRPSGRFANDVGKVLTGPTHAPAPPAAHAPEPLVQQVPVQTVQTPVRRPVQTKVVQNRFSLPEDF